MPVGRVGGVSVEAVANAHVAGTLHSSYTVVLRTNSAQLTENTAFVRTKLL